MSFTSALEDANSMACTVVRRLLTWLKIDEI